MDDFQKPNSNALRKQVKENGESSIFCYNASNLRARLRVGDIIRSQKKGKKESDKKLKNESRCLEKQVEKSRKGTHFSFILPVA